MHRLTLRRSSLARLALLTAALVLLTFGARMLAVGVLAGRIRHAARERGLTPSWRSLRVDFPARVRLVDFALTAPGGGAVLRLDTLSVRLDPLSFLVLHPAARRVDLAHARFRLLRGPAVDPDTLPPETPPAGVRSAERAARFRRSAENLVRVLLLPARRLPRLALRDVTLEAGSGERGEPAEAGGGVRLEWLDLAPARGGVRLAAAGTLALERDVPFAFDLRYEHDDRLIGGARFGIPDAERHRLEPVRIAVRGAIAQDRGAGVVRVSDSTRVTIGRVRFTLGGALERRGPRFTLSLAADGLTAEQWKQSLPRPLLGPLEGLSVRGTYDYRVSLDLDVSRPDSVRFGADVIPHGLWLDPSGTALNLAGLDQPFVASIHLPHDRIAERDLSTANPHYRPLEAMDSLLVYAVVTNEDGGFFHHRGFNAEAVRGAIADNIKAGAYRRGAGTITMQLVRNLYLGHARTLSRKAQEVVLAWVLEHLTLVGKRRLLEVYLNVIEWGPGIHGADEAAEYYFGHDAGRLTVDEALFLTTVVPAPTRWRYRFDDAGALRPFERAQMRFIGRAMVAKGWLAPESLPPAESLRVEIRGIARDALFPPESSTGADSTGTPAPGDSSAADSGAAPD